MGNKASSAGEKKKKKIVVKKVEQKDKPVEPRTEAEKRHEPSGVTFDEYPKRQKMQEDADEWSRETQTWG